MSNNLLNENDSASGAIQRIPVKEISVRATTEMLLNSLSAKQKLVLSNRFGVGNGSPKTLEYIGKSLNITRERVRQIESDAIRALGKIARDENLISMTREILEIVEEHGSIVLLGRLLDEFFLRYFNKHNYSQEEARIAEILFLLAGLKKMKSNREIRDSWAGSGYDGKYFKATVEEIETIFDKEKKILDIEDLLKKITYGEFPQKYPGLKPAHVQSFLEISKKFGRNVFGDWGKAKWPLINPRGVREKATLVLMKKRKPLHFRDISKFIEELKLSSKKVHAQTVHNELIRDKRFVLVGRGTYALREWGYEEGTVKDVIMRLLETAGGALAKNEIYQGVLKKRKVKKATIAVNLADRSIFDKKSGSYSLKKLQG